MLSKEKELQNKKKKIKAYAKILLGEDFDLIFLDKRIETKFTTTTLRDIDYLNGILKKMQENGYLKELNNRKQENVLVKYSLVKLLNKSARSFAEVLFNGDHTVVLYARKKSNEWLEIKDPLFMETYEKVKKILSEDEM